MTKWMLERHNIQGIEMPEPPRENEYPLFFEVGKPIPHDGPIVERITLRIENRGDHGIGWYDLWGRNELLQSINERSVARVLYAPKPKEKS